MTSNFQYGPRHPPSQPAGPPPPPHVLSRNRTRGLPAPTPPEPGGACPPPLPLSAARRASPKPLGQNAGAGGRPCGLPGLPPAAQRGASSLSMSSHGCPFLSFRRNQVVSMEQGQEQQLHDLDIFLSHVVDRLLSLLPPDSPTVALQNPKPLLSLAFLSKLLDALLDVDVEFRSLLLVRGATPTTAAPTSHPIADLLDRAVKSLDLCNGVSHSLHSLRHWLRHAHIASSALLLPRPHLLRAHRALSKLLPFDAGLPRNQRTSSFGRREASLRSLASSVSRNWSAHLAAPRGGEGGGGLAMAVYMISVVLVVAMWALGASVPGQERGGEPVAPSKVESCGRGLMEVVEEAAAGSGGGALLERERAQEVAERAAELAEACRRLEEGLGPLEMQVREVVEALQAAGGGGRAPPGCGGTRGGGDADYARNLVPRRLPHHLISDGVRVQLTVGTTLVQCW